MSKLVAICAFTMHPGPLIHSQNFCDSMGTCDIAVLLKGTDRHKLKPVPVQVRNMVNYKSAVRHYLVDLQPVCPVLRY